MKFVICRSSDWYGRRQPAANAMREIVNGEERWTCEINSLEELLQLSVDVGCPVIVDKLNDEGTFWELEIYDYYRE